MAAPALAPGIPPDYYSRIRAFEERNWWYRGMAEISGALLARHNHPGSRVLDAGCGTGGFLRALADTGSFSHVAGVDIATTAIEFARVRLPDADLRAAPLSELPFDDNSFDLVVVNDVLQHVDESELEASFAELRRVLARDGVILVRTNGSRQLRRERSDWRAYDPQTLRGQLEHAGLVVERLTHANCVLSVWGSLRGRVPHAPTEERDGIPVRDAPAIRSTIGLSLLRLEARALRLGISLPYGHTLFALARRS